MEQASSFSSLKLLKEQNFLLKKTGLRLSLKSYILFYFPILAVAFDVKTYINFQRISLNQTLCSFFLFTIRQ